MKNNTNPPLVTLHREITADLDTPVSVFLRLKDHGPSFLLESVTGGEQVARYSFIGVNPSQIFVIRGRQMEVIADDSTSTLTVGEDDDPLTFIRNELAPFSDVEHIHGLPRFFGGLVGYLGYDMIRFFEPKVDQQPHDKFPDSVLFHADSLVAFDHAFDRLILIANAPDHTMAQKRLDKLEQLLSNHNL
jgi:anthranilate synthase component 1